MTGNPSQSIDAAYTATLDLIKSLEQAGKITTIQADMLNGAASSAASSADSYSSELSAFLDYPLSYTASLFMGGADSPEQVKAYWQAFYLNASQVGVSDAVLDDFAAFTGVGQSATDTAFYQQYPYTTATTEQADEYLKGVADAVQSAGSAVNPEKSWLIPGLAIGAVAGALAAPTAALLTASAAVGSLVGGFGARWLQKQIGA